MFQDRRIERRHAGQEGGLLLGEIVHDHVDVRPRIDDHLVAVAHRAQHDSGQRIDVEQRQHTHDLLRASRRVGCRPGLALRHRRHHAAMGQHRGLGQARGAAGVLQQRHLIPQVALDRVREIGAVVVEQVLERHVPLVAGPRRDLFLLGERIEPVLGPGQIVGDRAHDQLLETCLAAHRGHLRVERHDIERDQDVGLAVAYFELELSCGVERRVVHHAATGLQDAEEGDQIVRRVGKIEADIDARPDAQLLEARRRMIRRLAIVGEGHHLVEEVGERPVAVLRAAFLEDLVDGLLRDVEFPGHAGGIALLPSILGHCLGSSVQDYGTRYE